MPRVKRGTVSHRRHKSVLREARGYVGGRHRLFRSAKETVMRAKRYAYRDRRVRKREFRRLWIARINAAARGHGLSYSRFMNGLKVSDHSGGRIPISISLCRVSMTQCSLVSFPAMKPLLSHLLYSVRTSSAFLSSRPDSGSH